MKNLLMHFNMLICTLYIETQQEMKIVFIFVMLGVDSICPI
jgi:hypothetical protein